MVDFRTARPVKYTDSLQARARQPLVLRDLGGTEFAVEGWADPAAELRELLVAQHPAVGCMDEVAFVPGDSGVAHTSLPEDAHIELLLGELPLDGIMLHYLTPEESEHDSSLAR